MMEKEKVNSTQAHDFWHIAELFSLSLQAFYIR